MTGRPSPVDLASIDLVLANAARAAPGTELAFIAYPGTPFTSSHHFAAFLRGDTAAASSFGFIAAFLWGDAGRYLSWLAIGLPIIVVGWLTASRLLVRGSYLGRAKQLPPPDNRPVA
jgi:hypothetical protein